MTLLTDLFTTAKCSTVLTPDIGFS